MTEYIIINKTEFEKIYKSLKKQREVEPDNYTQSYLDGKIKQLNEVLSQSTPLIPQIEKAFEAGFNFEKGWKGDYPNKKDYISQLKLDI